jgi:hypothetical protein
MRLSGRSSTEEAEQLRASNMALSPVQRLREGQKLSPRRRYRWTPCTTLVFQCDLTASTTCCIKSHD